MPIRFVSCRNRYIMDNSITQEKPIIGTHDSVTAHPPRKWWMKLGKVIAVTQDKTIWQQYEDGIRCFDLRIRLLKDNTWTLCHGLYEVKLDVYNLIYWLKEKAELMDENIYIRIVLEDKKHSDKEAERFIKFCEWCDDLSTRLIFICGNRKSDWKQLYKFAYPNQQQWMPVSSCAEDARWYEKAFPRLYAKRMNEHNLKNIPKKYGFAFFDFI